MFHKNMIICFTFILCTMTVEQILFELIILFYFFIFLKN